MAYEITIQVGQTCYYGELNQSPEAEQVWNALPLTGDSNVWGDEIYFAIPVTMDETSEAREIVDVGTVAYWPPGQALCIFYGPTPVSRDERPRAYSPVNILGTIGGDLNSLKAVTSGTPVVVTAGHQK